MKTINHILLTLNVHNDSTIEDLKNHFNCEYYDIINSLFENNIIQFSENGFVESEHGKQYIKSGNNIRSFVWDIELCNFLLYDILFSGKKRYRILNQYYERIYNGENIIKLIYSIYSIKLPMYIVDYIEKYIKINGNNTRYKKRDIIVLTECQ